LGGSLALTACAVTLALLTAYWHGTQVLQDAPDAGLAESRGIADVYLNPYAENCLLENGGNLEILEVHAMMRDLLIWG
jgi:hypothetical protein